MNKPETSLCVEVIYFMQLNIRKYDETYVVMLHELHPLIIETVEMGHELLLV